MNTLASTSLKAETTQKDTQNRYLFGPIIDFLGLGGASVIALILLALVTDPQSIQPQVAFAFILIANVINHPHFAHSYQIFYRDFGRKIGTETPANLRYRYWFAGIIAPIAIILFYTFTVMFGDVRWIGYSINLMMFLVGWHYVKQGYGMLSVDSVLKKKFFNDEEKRLLLWNAYATWAFSYVYTNNVLSTDYNMFGISRYAFSVPYSISLITFAVMAGFTIMTLLMFARRALPGGKGIPVNGVCAYLISLYIWLIAIRFNPLFAFVIPAFHSLQYMMVTTRFQLNVETEKAQSGHRTVFNKIIKNAPIAGLVQFYVVGALLGGLAFWGLPFIITMTTNLEPAGFPTMWAFAIFWIFVNVHHYLLDNVMWRKGNPDVAKHLFSH